MAKLVTTKEKYGISVATRIEPQLAHHIASKAERLGVTMSKMIGMIISESISSNGTRESAYQQQIAELNDDLIVQQNMYRDAMARFIENVAEDDEQVYRLVESYNSILETLKNSNNG
jgi:antitoxin component of RelBE/YafQ-DinJ toxin-antitoxin module